jgi:hypothetical protein
MAPNLQMLAAPSNTQTPWQMPTISAARLKKIWHACSLSTNAEWLQALKDIRSRNAQRLREKTASHYTSRSPSNEPGVTVTLLSDNFIHQTPSITLTSALSSPPSMGCDTWNELGLHVWSTTDVHITLHQKSSRKQHKKSSDCWECRHAAKKNHKHMEKMTGKRVSMFDLKGYWENRTAWKQRMWEMDAENEKREEHEGLAADANLDGVIGMMEKMSLEDKVVKVKELRRTRKVHGIDLRQMADDHLQEKVSLIVPQSCITFGSSPGYSCHR